MTLTIPFQYADSLPLVPESEHSIAYIIDVTTGALVDEAGNFETAINYIQDGQHIACAIQAETHWCLGDPECSYCSTYGSIIRTQEALQASFDHERRLQEDCFGLQVVAA
jgi:hypothetical protein